MSPLPAVQASIAANTYVVSGSPVVKTLQELMPGILSQMGPEGFKAMQSMLASAGAGADDNTDDMPELEATDFEAVSKE